MIGFNVRESRLFTEMLFISGRSVLSLIFLYRALNFFDNVLNNDSIKIFLCVEEYGEPNNLVIKIVYKKACEKLVNRNYIAGMCTLLP